MVLSPGQGKRLSQSAARRLGLITSFYSSTDENLCGHVGAYSYTAAAAISSTSGTEA